MNLFKYCATLLLMFAYGNTYTLRTVIFVNNSNARVAIETRSRTEWDFQPSQTLTPNSTVAYSFDLFSSGLRITPHAFAEIQASYFDRTRGAYSAPYRININAIREAVANCQNSDVTVELLPIPANFSGHEAPTKITCNLPYILEEAPLAIDVKEPNGPYKVLGVSKNATPFQILGLPERAPETQIRQAWKHLSMKWHPRQSTKVNVADENDIATQIAQIINNAKDEALDIIAKKTHYPTR